MPRLSKKEEMYKWLRSNKYYLAELDFITFKSTILVVIDPDEMKTKTYTAAVQQAVIEQYAGFTEDRIKVVSIPQDFIIA